MMASRQYTVDQLLRLRASPLVQKPDNLPAIEQWIEYVYIDVDGGREKLRIPHSETQQPQHQPRDPAVPRRQPRLGAGDASPMGSFTTGSRPSLLSTRSAANRSGGQYILFLQVRTIERLTKMVEDISLGPPRTVFTSSRTASRLADFSADKAAAPASNENTPGDEAESTPRSRFFGGDKTANRKSMGIEENEGGHARYGSWTQERERRALVVQDDGIDGSERSTRYGRRDRDKGPDGERRNGHDEKPDHRWGHKEERRPNGERQGGWREREREREKRGGRDWDRGHDDKEPEWMEEPAPKHDDELNPMNQPKNQEDFEKWKQAQRARGRKQMGDAVLDELPLPEKPPAKPTESLKIDFVDKTFGGLGEPRTSDIAPASTRSTAAKSTKTSRFMPMFKKDEPKDEPPPPLDMSTQIAPQQQPNGSTEDKAAFDRVMLMLKKPTLGEETNAALPTSPPSKPVQQNGAKPKSRFTGFFDQSAKSPERLQSPPSSAQDQFKPMDSSMLQNGRGMSEEPSNVFGAELPSMRTVEQQSKSRAPASALSSDPMPQDHGRRIPQSRPNDQFFETPSRGAGTPEVAIQNLIAAQHNSRQSKQLGGQDKNQEFLLNLLQTKGSSRPPSQQARPEGNFHPNQLWLPEQPPPNLQEPKPRGAPPPPGHSMDDQLLRNYPQLEQQQQPQQMQSNDLPQRRASQRAPPGFFEQQELFLQQQQQQQHRRNFTEPPQQHGMPPGRRMSGHPNLPQMQMPLQQAQYAPPPQDFLQSPGGLQQVPPPGFNPHMPRHPPGFGSDIPNIFQAPQQQRQPPGFAGMAAMQATSPPNAPPGFYGGPPGMNAGPSGFMQMRSPTEGVQVGMRGNGRGGFEGFEGMGQRR